MNENINNSKGPLNYYTKSNAISRKGEKEKKQTKTNMKKKRSGAVYMRRINLWSEI
jgi:hypothetical protein